MRRLQKDYNRGGAHTLLTQPLTRLPRSHRERRSLRLTSLALFGSRFSSSLTYSHFGLSSQPPFIGEGVGGRAFGQPPSLTLQDGWWPPRWTLVGCLPIVANQT
ncbi:unnamed protein product [Camellia sinensis]